MKQIMHAAAQVYLEKGMQLEVRDVADKAELGYGTVYHYYKNKHMLLEDLLWDALDIAEKTIQPDGDPRDARLPRAELLCRRLLGGVMAQPSMFILLKTVADNFHHFPGNRFGKLSEEFQKRIFSPLASAVREELDAASPEITANVLFGSLIGCAALAIHHQTQAELDADRVVAMIFSGLRPREREQTW
ncbi:TetR/AcrR family transcriptional regulator [Paenibacillus sabuli]